MKRSYYLLFLCFASVLSCTEEHSLLDKQLKYAINTSPNTPGLHNYIMPKSDDFDRIPQDHNNPLTKEKVHLGQLLFHETIFSTAGNFDNLKNTYSCASCHHSAAGFQAGTRQGIGDGGIGFGVSGEGRKMDVMAAENLIDVQPVRTPSALNSAYQTNLLWNGQFGATAVNVGTEENWKEGTPIATNKLGYEGLETQAIAGIAVHKIKYDEASITSSGYKEYFDRALPNLSPERRYSAEGAGLAMAAYERTLLATESPFQQWLRGDLKAMTDAQKEGAKIFFGKGECANCHNGASLANMEFHAIGLGDFSTHTALNIKDADKAFLGRASFTGKEADRYKFKVPQLYNLKDSPFYGHGGTFTSVRAVIDYKNKAISENSNVKTEALSPFFKPLRLSEQEIDLLTDFIENGLYDPNLSRYLPAELLSQSCFPNNDPLSKMELGCE